MKLHLRVLMKMTKFGDDINTETTIARRQAEMVQILWSNSKSYKKSDFRSILILSEGRLNSVH